MITEQMLDEIVNRFLSWKLPINFSPDAGISFTPSANPNCWPTGTNLFTAVQAREMFKYVLAAILTQSSDANAPSATSAFMCWADTSTDKMKIRNAANNAWIKGSHNTSDEPEQEGE